MVVQLMLSVAKSPLYNQRFILDQTLNRFEALSFWKIESTLPKKDANIIARPSYGTMH